MTTPTEHSRWSLPISFAAVAATAMFTLASTTGRPLEPFLSYDGSSYLDVAEHLVTTGHLPPLELRPPLYPLLLAAFMRMFGESALRYVVFLQAGCWVASALLVTALTYQLSRRATLAGLAGVLYTSLSEPQYHVRLVYAEGIGTVLALAAGVVFTETLRRRDRETPALHWAVALLAAAAAYARPVFQLLLPLFAFLVVADRWLTGRRLRARLAPILIVLLVGFAPWYVSHRVTRGAAFFTKGLGYTLANYLGDRRLLGHFPPEYSALEHAYATRFASKPEQRYIGWWEVYPEWPRLHVARTGDPLPADLIHADMARAAFSVLVRNPRYTVTRWWETWTEFATDAGWRPRGDWSPIHILWPAWRVFFRAVGRWLPFVLVIGEAALQRARGQRALYRFVPITLYLATAIASTALEPWPGQLRYRAPIDGLFLAAWVGGLGGWVSVLFRRERPAPDSRGSSRHS